MENLITCNGAVTKLQLSEGITRNFTLDELETLQYAVWAYGYVNCTGFAVYSISIQTWIENIKQVFDMSCLRTKAVLNVLNKLI